MKTNTVTARSRIALGFAVLFLLAGFIAIIARLFVPTRYQSKVSVSQAYGDDVCEYPNEDDEKARQQRFQEALKQVHRARIQLNDLIKKMDQEQKSEKKKATKVKRSKSTKVLKNKSARRDDNYFATPIPSTYKNKHKHDCSDTQRSGEISQDAIFTKDPSDRQIIASLYDKYLNPKYKTVNHKPRHLYLDSIDEQAMAGKKVDRHIIGLLNYLTISKGYYIVARICSGYDSQHRISRENIGGGGSVSSPHTNGRAVDIFVIDDLCFSDKYNVDSGDYYQDMNRKIFAIMDDIFSFAKQSPGNRPSRIFMNSGWRNVNFNPEVKQIYKSLVNGNGNPYLTSSPAFSDRIHIQFDQTVQLVSKPKKVARVKPSKPKYPPEDYEDGPSGNEMAEELARLGKPHYCNKIDYPIVWYLYNRVANWGFDGTTDTILMDKYDQSLWNNRKLDKCITELLKYLVDNTGILCVRIQSGYQYKKWKGEREQEKKFCYDYGKVLRESHHDDAMAIDFYIINSIPVEWQVSKNKQKASQARQAVRSLLNNIFTYYGPLSRATTLDQKMLRPADIYVYYQNDIKYFERDVTSMMGTPEYRMRNGMWRSPKMIDHICVRF